MTISNIMAATHPNLFDIVIGAGIVNFLPQSKQPRKALIRDNKHGENQIRSQSTKSSLSTARDPCQEIPIGLFFAPNMPTKFGL
jgi:hypothetical protein